MRIRAKANGNVSDVDEEQARALIGTGIYETVDALPEQDPVAESPPKPNKPKRRYKRRDMTAEE